MPSQARIIRFYSIIMISFILLITPIIVGVQTLTAKTAFPDWPWLLNSGFAQSQEARGKILVWVQQERELPKIEGILQSSGTIWQKEVLTNYFGKFAYKYSTNFQSKKENEGQAVELFMWLNQSLEGLEAKTYYEERIDSAIDLKSYFDFYGIDVINQVQAEGIFSVSGFYPGIDKIVQASSPINVQLITKHCKGTAAGKTVLAIPALLEEF